MICIFWRHKRGKFTYTVKEWRCCGYIWQLLMSYNYPERYNWKPTCPKCGKRGG